MIVVFGNLLLDVLLHMDEFPLQAGQMQKAAGFQLGPGGAGNVAIACVRFGLPAASLGEIGADEFGDIVRRGLVEEGVSTTHVAVTAGAATPVAAVLVDRKGQPAYVGFPGNLSLRTLPPSWRELAEQAKAVFVDGWVEYEGAANMAVEILRYSRRAGVPTFFDPGPGNPGLDNAWHTRALAESSVALVNQEEASRLSGQTEPEAAGRSLLRMGPEVVLIKLGAVGCLALRGHDVVASPGFSVPVVDATGAGDSVAGAMIFGWLRGLPLLDLAVLANATGAAKVQKLGTGRSMPTREEIRAVLQAAGHDPDRFVPV